MIKSVDSVDVYHQSVDVKTNQVGIFTRLVWKFFIFGSFLLSSIRLSVEIWCRLFAKLSYQEIPPLSFQPRWPHETSQPEVLGKKWDLKKHSTKQPRKWWKNGGKKWKTQQNSFFFGVLVFSLFFVWIPWVLWVFFHPKKEIGKKPNF